MEEVIKQAWKSLHKIDEQSRFQLPLIFRPEDDINSERKYVVVKGEGEFLSLMTYDYWVLCIKENAPKRLDDFDFEDYMEVVLGMSYITKAESQWRIKIPEELKEYAGIESEVLVVGLGWKMSLWKPENYAKHKISIGIDEKEVSKNVFKRNPLRISKKIDQDT